MTTVTVTWMDGTTYTYRCESAKVDSGVLYLLPYRHDVSTLIRKIPLHNVKIWTEEPR